MICTTTGFCKWMRARLPANCMFSRWTTSFTYAKDHTMYRCKDVMLWVQVLFCSLFFLDFEKSCSLRSAFFALFFSVYLSFFACKLSHYGDIMTQPTNIGALLGIAFAPEWPVNASSRFALFLSNADFFIF